MQTACLHPCSPPTQWSFNTAPVLHLFPSLQIRLPVGPPFATFFHSSSLPLSPALFPNPQLTSPGAHLLPVCDSHLLLVYPSSGTIFAWRPPREEGVGACSLYQELPLAAECSNPPCRWKSSSEPRGYIALGKSANTVWPCGGPVMKSSVKMDSSIHLGNCQTLSRNVPWYFRGASV